MSKPLILGVAASLRNARFKEGARNLINELKGLADREALEGFIAEQAKIHVDQFVASGRADGLPFDELYKKLRQLGGLRGLSNSEVCLAAALWSAWDKGCDIGHVSLADHFPANGVPVDVDALKTRLREADGIILASPVYFGDRSSLAQHFIEMIRSDDALRADLAGKVYAGVAVGAKRNGGQETTLIYQMLDMLNLGLLGVGNDSDTTSQYGGTAHAGDIGTIVKDSYGINTCMGTGRRIARVAIQCVTAAGVELADLPRLDFWFLQDREGALARLFAPFRAEILERADIRENDLTRHHIRPCIACDICPTHVGPDTEYRCIIKRKDDGVVIAHDDLLRPDVLVPTLFSPKDRRGLVSVYQEFMERTRYLRRGDYVFTDRLVMPLVFAEIGANENLEIRAMTSFVRHHTVLLKPITAWLHDGEIINADEVRDGLSNAIAYGSLLTRGRLSAAAMRSQGVHYNPVGYVLSHAKDNERTTMAAREQATQLRQEKLVEQSHKRLVTIIARAASADGS